VGAVLGAAWPASKPGIPGKCTEMTEDEPARILWDVLKKQQGAYELLQMF